MKRLSLKVVLATLVCAAGVTRVAALDHAMIIAQPDVPASALSPSALKDLLTGKTTYWDGGQAVVIVSMGDKAEEALQEASGMSSSQFKTFWQRLTFSGRGQQPKSADSIDKVLALVADTKGAIAVVPPGTELKGVKKIEIK